MSPTPATPIIGGIMRTKIVLAGLVATTAAGFALALPSGANAAPPTAPSSGCSAAAPVHVSKISGSGSFTASAVAATGEAGDGPATTKVMSATATLVPA